jgi:hypothetical protein
MPISHIITLAVCQIAILTLKLPVSYKERYGRSLLSSSSHLERARELGQHRPAPVMLTTVWQVREGEEGEQGTISIAADILLSLASLMTKHMPTLCPARSAHQRFACPSLPCDGSYIYPCW